MRKNSGTIRHTIAGAALVLMLMPVGRAGAEAPGCDWTGSAFWKGADPAQVDRCIAAGADPKARTKWGLTPLHWAAFGGTREAVAALVKAGTDLEAWDEDSDTPLHVAALGGSPETVAALLDAGADLEARDGNGRSPAELAEDNDAVRDHGIFWTLNQARFD